MLEGHGPHPTLRAGGQEGLSAEGAPRRVLKNKVQRNKYIKSGGTDPRKGEGAAGRGAGAAGAEGGAVRTPRHWRTRPRGTHGQGHRGGMPSQEPVSHPGARRS